MYVHRLHNLVHKPNVQYTIPNIVVQFVSLHITCEERLAVRFPLMEGNQGICVGNERTDQCMRILVHRYTLYSVYLRLRVFL